MPFQIGATELIILLVVLLLVFGPKRLPEMGRSVGRGIREFKDSVSGDEKRDEPAAAVTPAPPSQTGTGEPAKTDSERVAS